MFADSKTHVGLMDYARLVTSHRTERLYAPVL